MKTIVVSGINLFRGGTLKIIQDCIAALAAFAGRNYKIIALVHDEKLFQEYENVTYIAYPKSRKSWLYRIYYEYVGFKKLSKQLKPYAWFSLHDTTPNVIAEKRMVYCHNTFPFYHAGWKNWFVQPEIVMFSLFSRYIHRINIRKNTYVIVQQEWLREAFEQMFSIHNVVVSLPVQTIEPFQAVHSKLPDSKEKIRFFYPVTPMIHKNYEVICRAVALLEKSGITNFEVLFTFHGSENRYTKKIVNSYRSLKSLHFIGFLNREEMNRLYHDCDCLLFSSKVESWGLPATEAQELNLPVLISDLPYAKETIGKYDWVKFFDPDNATQLSEIMKQFIAGTLIYDDTEEVLYREPFSRNWNELTHYLFS
jgi:glycosyltransferase involved in cell wall biosynthesis